MLAIISIILLSLTVQSTSPDPWINMRFFVGSWNGSVSGQPGNGTAVPFQMVDRSTPGWHCSGGVACEPPL
jgi:hypothetical protein